MQEVCGKNSWEAGEVCETQRKGIWCEMILPTRNKILCELVSREKVLRSGIILPDRVWREKKENVCRCLGVGDGVKVIRRTDLAHHKIGFGVRFEYEGKKLIALKAEEVICVERGDEIIALGSTIIAKLIYEDKMGSIIIPDQVKQNSGGFWGEVKAIGPDFVDKDLSVGDKINFLRGEGYTFRSYMGRKDLHCIQEKWIYGRSK